MGYEYYYFRNSRLFKLPDGNLFFLSKWGKGIIINIESLYL